MPGKVFLQIVLGEGGMSLSDKLKNMGFLIKHVPSAGRKMDSPIEDPLDVFPCRQRFLGAPFCR